MHSTNPWFQVAFIHHFCLATLFFVLSLAGPPTVYAEQNYDEAPRADFPDLAGRLLQLNEGEEINIASIPLSEGQASLSASSLDESPLSDVSTPYDVQELSIWALPEEQEGVFIRRFLSNGQVIEEEKAPTRRFQGVARTSKGVKPVRFQMQGGLLVGTLIDGATEYSLSQEVGSSQALTVTPEPKQDGFHDGCGTDAETLAPESFGPGSLNQQFQAASEAEESFPISAMDYDALREINVKLYISCLEAQRYTSLDKLYLSYSHHMAQVSSVFERYFSIRFKIHSYNIFESCDADPTYYPDGINKVANEEIIGLIRQNFVSSTDSYTYLHYAFVHEDQIQESNIAGLAMVGFVCGGTGFTATFGADQDPEIVTASHVTIHEFGHLLSAQHVSCDCPEPPCTIGSCPYVMLPGPGPLAFSPVNIARIENYRELISCGVDQPISQVGLAPSFVTDVFGPLVPLANASHYSEWGHFGLPVIMPIKAIDPDNDLVSVSIDALDDSKQIFWGLSEGNATYLEPFTCENYDLSYPEQQKYAFLTAVDSKGNYSIAQAKATVLPPTIWSTSSEKLHLLANEPKEIHLKDRNIIGENLYTIDVRSLDNDFDPTWMSLDSQTGVLKVTPPVTEIGNRFSVDLESKACGRTAAYSTAYFDIVPDHDTPFIGNGSLPTVVTPDRTSGAALYVSGGNNVSDNLEVTLLSELPQGVSFDSERNYLNWDLTSLSFPYCSSPRSTEQEIRFRVTDLESGVSSDFVYRYELRLDYRELEGSVELRDREVVNPESFPGIYMLGSYEPGDIIVLPFVAEISDTSLDPLVGMSAETNSYFLEQVADGLIQYEIDNVEKEIRFLIKDRPEDEGVYVMNEFFSPEVSLNPCGPCKEEDIECSSKALQSKRIRFEVRYPRKEGTYPSPTPSSPYEAGESEEEVDPYVVTDLDIQRIYDNLNDLFNLLKKAQPKTKRNPEGFDANGWLESFDLFNNAPLQSELSFDSKQKRKRARLVTRTERFVSRLPNTKKRRFRKLKKRAKRITKQLLRLYHSL